MTQTSALESPTATPARSQRANDLATRLEQGARALSAFAAGLTDAQWHMTMPHDGRTLGVIVHHVASVYPVEIHLAEVLASGQPIAGITIATIDEMNAKHALEHKNATKDEALDLLAANSAAAAASIRTLTDEQLATAAITSLYSDAPVTCQFLLEDHAVRHSYHHLARLRRAIGQ